MANKEYKTTSLKKKNSHEEILNKMRERFNVSEQTYSQQRIEALEDFRFRFGEQWDPQVLSLRKLENRPCITVNKLGQYVRQVVNAQKINRPSINVNPNDSQASLAIAKVMQAIIKNIEIKSMAENAYDQAFSDAATGGEGYFRIVTDYVDNMSFEQDIYIESIDNPFSVYIDPEFKNDFLNIKYAFIFSTISKDEFEREYPNSSCSQGAFWVGPGDSWITSNQVRIAEYFYKEYIEQEIVQLTNGEVLLKEDFLKIEEELSSGVEIVKTRKTHKEVVHWIKTNGHEILEETIFPGTYIPVIPVFAETYYVDGRRIFEGIIRQAKDTQRMINFHTNTEIEQLFLAPKAPYLIAKGQIEGFENIWAQANSKNYPYLPYNSVDSNGSQLPAPTRNQFDPQINTVINAKAGASEDLKAITGMYDAALGQQKVEASGKAIITQQRQSEVTNFMYIDNLCKSLKYAGKILLEIIPIIYDTKRVVRIKGSSNQEDEVIVINSFDEKEPIFLDVGKYDVDVSIGPYGENQRQDAIESMLSLMQINPEISGLIGDIFVSKQNWDGAKEISERLKIMLPPQLQQNNNDLPPEVAAQVQQAQLQYEQTIQQQEAQLQQMQQLLAALNQELNKVSADYNNKTAEIQSKERIELMKADVQLQIAKMKEMGLDDRNVFSKELEHPRVAKEMGKSVIPPVDDQYVLPGINDVLTKANEEVEEDLSDEEKLALMQQLDNFTSETTGRSRV